MKLFPRALLPVFVGAVSLMAQPVATVQITRTPQGPTVPPGYIGLSVEESIGKEYFGTETNTNTVFMTLMKNLGVGTLRMGGESEDEDCWGGAPAPDPSQCGSYTLSNADFQSWVNASAITGWPIILGVNLVQAESPGAPQYIVDEVTTGFLPVLQSEPGASLMAIETGNEINLYHLNGDRPSSYNLQDQESDLLSYMTALKANSATKSIPIAVPAYYDPIVETIQQDIDPLLATVSGCSGCSGNAGLAVLHEYPLTLAGGNVPTIPELLSPSTLQGEITAFTLAVNDMQSLFGLLVQVDETGSTSIDPGEPGVANVQAAALWALDYELAMAQIGVHGLNFHCHEGSYYPPINVTASGGKFTNTITPCYYSLYAFGSAKGQQFLPVAVTTSANITAYALSKGSTDAITLYIVNKDLSASGEVQIGLSSPAHAASYVELSAPSLSSLVEDVTLGGVQFSTTTGALTGALQVTNIQPSNGLYTVTLPNAAAIIMTIHP